MISITLPAWIFYLVVTFAVLYWLVAAVSFTVMDFLGDRRGRHWVNKLLWAAVWLIFWWAIGIGVLMSLAISTVRDTLRHRKTRREYEDFKHKKILNQ